MYTAFLELPSLSRRLSSGPVRFLSAYRNLGMILVLSFVISASCSNDYAYLPTSGWSKPNKWDGLKFAANFGTAQDQFSQQQQASNMNVQNDLQSRPTFQKVVYFGYPPPFQHKRRRRLLPYFFLGLAAGSAALLGGAVAAGGLGG